MLNCGHAGIPGMPAVLMATCTPAYSLPRGTEGSNLAGSSCKPGVTALPARPSELTHSTKHNLNGALRACRPCRWRARAPSGALPPAQTRLDPSCGLQPQASPGRLHHHDNGGLATTWALVNPTGALGEVDCWSPRGATPGASAPTAPGAPHSQLWSSQTCKPPTAVVVHRCTAVHPHTTSDSRLLRGAPSGPAQPGFKIAGLESQATMPL
jgi:hypothetical protein